MSIQFSASVYRSQGWLCVEIPFDVQEVFGTRSRMAVEMILKEHCYHSSIFPTGAGKHFMMINKTMQKECDIHEGDTIQISLEIDTSPRIVEIPSDLQDAFQKDNQAAKAFESFPPSHRREFVQYITEAKKPETRIRRIKKTLDDLKTKYNKLKGK